MGVMRDSEIKSAIGGGLLTDWDLGSVRGASYDIRAGSLAITVEPKPPRGEGIRYVALDQQLGVTIKPGNSCIIRSRELVKMPKNMMGILHNRMEWVHKRLNFDGGLVDPGYHGYLFMTVTNLGDTDVEVKYECPFVALLLVALAGDAERVYPAPAKGRPYLDTLPQDKLPESPEGARYAIMELSKRIDELTSRLNSTQTLCGSRGATLDANARIMDGVVLGGLAGLIGGAILAIFLTLKYPVSLYVSMSCVAVGIVACLIRRSRKGRKQT